ncbi:hypothetical protein L1285_16695 [Pseudoalteromonas sp. DL2-H2.2]|uniref:hypothetical protein n=1 Tax=Pseudoalteromonas sp. DL2-H2.2 TaxID=2908889 RepID=UPI001F221A15|nr:hypothetical protein [Pseudoalteromonas sp. DL2-H2.2]MCF2909962.1 hypothetical protein [Pseudoalteromonas sp. DL2-H2.2]
MNKDKLNIDTLVKGHTVFIESDWFRDGESAVVDLTLNLKGDHVNVISLPIQLENLHKLGITYLLEREQAKVGNRLAGYDFKGRAVHETDLLSLSVPDLTVRYQSINVNEHGENTVLVTMTAETLAQVPGFEITGVIFAGAVPQRMTLKQWLNKSRLGQPRVSVPARVMFDETHLFGCAHSTTINLATLSQLSEYTTWLTTELLPNLDDDHLDLLSTALDTEKQQRKVAGHA